MSVIAFFNYNKHLVGRKSEILRFNQKLPILGKIDFQTSRQDLMGGPSNLDPIKTANMTNTVFGGPGSM